jgi:hypothetical protein
VSALSIQFGIAVAPSLPQRLQRMRGPKDGTVASSGQPSMLTRRSWPQCWQVTTIRGIVDYLKMGSIRVRRINYIIIWIILV